MKILSDKEYRELEEARLERDTLKDELTTYPALQNDAEWSAYLTGKGVDSQDFALQIAAVFRCVDLGSKTMATLPLHLFEQDKKGNKKKAINNPLFNITYVMPNRYTTAYEFWQMYVANVMLTRGGFAKIVRDNRGNVIELWNIPTNKVSRVQWTDTGRRYIVVELEDQKVETLFEGEYLYTAGFRFNNDDNAHDPMVLAAKVLGLASDMNTFAGKGFGGVSPGGYVEYPTGMSDKAYERFKNSFYENYGGVQNAGKWIFLELGSKAVRWDYDMEKTQLLDSRKFAVSDICRVFGIPPHLCFDLEHATFSNIEQQSMEFVRDFVNPLAVRIEQSLYRDLLTEKQKQSMFWKFNLNGLLRGDTATRMEAYAKGRQNGWLSANDIRELEDMNGIGPAGDAYFVNGNMLPLEAALENKPKSAQTKEKTT